MLLARFNLLLSVVASGHAFGQEAVPLILEGDDVPGLGTVRLLNNVQLLPNGSWLVLGDTNGANTDFVMRDGVVRLHEGQVMANPPGAEIGFIGTVSGDSQGRVSATVVFSNTPANQNSAIYLNDTLLALEGQNFNGGNFSGQWLGFSYAWMNDANQILINGAATNSVAVLGVMDVTNGTNQGFTVQAYEGQVPPGQSEPIILMAGAQDGFDINDSGSVLWGARTDALFNTNDVAYRDDELLAQEGSSTGEPGWTWSSVGSADKRMNDNGDWIMTTGITNGSDSESVIVKNGVVLYRTGQSLPDIAPFSLIAFNSGGTWGGNAARIANTGQVLWYGRWQEAPGVNHSGIFLDDKLVVLLGVTQSGGQTITHSSDADLAEDEKSLIFVALLDAATRGVFRLDLEAGATYCTSTVNSSGAAASIAALGSPSLAVNNLRLEATDLPTSSFGIFFYGDNAAQVPFGNGFRCVTGSIRRLGPAALSSASGELARDIDNLALPAGDVFMAGSTRRFQCWFRDQPAGGHQFNLSDGIAITFAP